MRRLLGPIPLQNNSLPGVIAPSSNGARVAWALVTMIDRLMMYGRIQTVVLELGPCSRQRADSFADAGGGPGKSFLLFFRLPEAP